VTADQSAPRTIAYGRCGRHVVLAHAAGNPSDAEWQLYIKDIDRWISELAGILVVTEGGALTSGQRRELNDIFARAGQKSFRVAVLSRNLLARGIVNALSLWNPGIRMFKPEAVDQALAHIGASFDGPAVLAEVDRLRQRLRG
jgi:hypothetical protein